MVIMPKEMHIAIVTPCCAAFHFSTCACMPSITLGALGRQAGRGGTAERLYQSLSEWKLPFPVRSITYGSFERLATFLLVP